MDVDPEEKKEIALFVTCLKLLQDIRNRLVRRIVVCLDENNTGLVSKLNGIYILSLHHR